MQRGKNEEIY